MNTYNNKWAAVLLFLSFSANSLAVPIAYDESIDGDLSVDSFIYYGEAFEFSTGTNTIAGNMGIGRDYLDFDTFFFIVPENMQLESITYSFWNVNNEANLASYAAANFTLRDGIDNAYLGSSGRIDVISTSDPVSLFEDPLPYSSDFTDLLPLEPDTYLFGHSLSSGFGAGAPYNVTWDYSIDFKVTTSSVPEPPTIIILLLGLFFIFVPKFATNKSFNLTSAKTAPST